MTLHLHFLKPEQLPYSSDPKNVKVPSTKIMPVFSSPQENVLVCFFGLNLKSHLLLSLQPNKFYYPLF